MYANPRTEYLNIYTSQNSWTHQSTDVHQNIAI